MENEISDFDFGGYATRNDLLCGDGRTIRKNAFKDDDGRTVPVIWNHDHSNPEAVLGHALLENRNDGVYAYCKFNDSDAGKNARILVEHGDVRSLSIYANQLKQIGSDVVHGTIRELSLVLAGANPGAFIDSVMSHGDDEGDCAIVNYDENALTIFHSENSEKSLEMTHSECKKEEPKMEEKEEKKSETTENGKTIGEIFDSLNPEQKEAVYAIVGMVSEGGEENEEDESEGGNETMKHNLFENDTNSEETLMHSAIVNDAIADAKRYGSMKESFIQHAAANNITNYELLLPEPTSMTTAPEWIKDDESWVSKIMGAVHRTPFSRVKSLFATLDENEARARGYIKGNMKKDLALSVLKRTTLPTTVYIKMKMDRDDAVDITEFDVVAWQRAEMRGQLDKELARAMLLGDGRDLSSDDKINEQNIRPVLKDDDMYTIKYTVKAGQDYNVTTNSASDNDSVAKGIIRAAVKSRKEYKGSGKPTFFTTEDVLTELLLIEDQNGRRIYESEATLATAMRVKEIVTVPEMESHTDIYGIIVNMADYNTGADKGGAVNMFDDFDIDYNQMKYLMETRMSGALVRPYSAIVLKKEESVVSG